MAMQGGFGVAVKIMVSATLTAVAHLLDMDPFVLSKTLADMTGHDAQDGYSEFMDTGKRAIGGFKVTLGWDATDDTHAAIVAAFNSTEPVQMSVADPDGVETIVFLAHIEELGRVMKQNDGYKCTVSIQPTGRPTITTAP